MWTIIEREPTQAWEATEEYVSVWGDFGCVRVSHAVAMWIAEITARRLRPRWLEFVDATGALVRIRTNAVQEMRDSSVRLRSRARIHREMIDAEEGW